MRRYSNEYGDLLHGCLVGNQIWHTFVGDPRETHGPAVRPAEDPWETRSKLKAEKNESFSAPSKTIFNTKTSCMLIVQSLSPKLFAFKFWISCLEYDFPTTRKTTTLKLAVCQFNENCFPRVWLNETENKQEANGSFVVTQSVVWPMCSVYSKSSLNSGSDRYVMSNLKPREANVS